MKSAYIAIATQIFAAILPVSTAMAQPPLEVYGTLPDVWGLDISPSGKRFGYFSYKDGSNYFAIAEIGSGIIGGGSTGDVKPRSIFFPNDDYAVVIGSETLSTSFYKGKWENSSAFAFNIDNKKFTTLLKGFEELFQAQTGLGHIVGKLEGQDVVFMPAYIGTYGSNPEYGLLKARLNLSTATIESRGTHDSIDWFVDRKGVILAREDYEEDSHTYRVFTGVSGALQKIYETEGATDEIGGILGPTPDGSGLILSRWKDGEEIISFSKLKFDGEIVDSKLNFDANKSIERTITDINRTVLGVQYAGLRPSYKFFDAALDAEMARLVSQFPDDSVHYAGATDDLSKIVLSIEGGATAPGFFLYDRKSQRFGKLAQKYSEIGENEINPVLTIEYKARDGIAIPTIITIPRGRTIGESLPMVVLPHGGPAAYDAVGFDWMAQFFASRGYMVFQPNFRGSYGFGKAHREAGHGEWGGKMQDDITDGVELLVRKQWADPERICIVGGSYGGYAALAGGAYTPDLYKCVVAIAPVADLDMFLTTVKRDAGSDSAVFAWWTKLIGDRKTDKQKIASISPVKAAANFKAPVMLIHGNDDTVVPFLHSLKMETALKAANKPVTLVKLRKEDHWLSQAETRLQALQAMDKFVRESLDAK